MTNRTTLVVCAAVLAGLIAAVLLQLGGDPGELRGPTETPSSPTSPTAEATLESNPVESASGSGDAAPRATVASNATTASLLVIVRWPEGAPAAGIAISVLAAARGLPMSVLAREVSDDRGEVRVAGLPVCPVRLRSERGGEGKAELVAGRLTTVEFTLPAGIEITGTVVDRQDRPVAGAEIWLQTRYRDWTAGRVIARAGADGAFALRGIPAGLSLGAIAAGFAPSALLDLDTVDTSSPPVAIRLVLEGDGAAVEGRALDRAGNPVRGAIVAVGKSSDNLQHRAGDQWIEQWTPRTTATDADGHFALAALETGTSPVAVWARGFGFWRTEVTLAAGDRQWLDVVLGESVTVSGTVIDAQGKPLAGALVQAYDTMPRTTFIQGGQIDFDETFGHVGAQSDEHGRYRLTGATPGDVHLFAQPMPDGRRGWSVPFARAVLAAEPGSELEWNPVVEPGRTIEGVVLYSDGQPMGDVFVTAKDEQGGPQHVLCNDKEGRFRLVCLEGASYSLHVQYWSPPKGTPPLEKAGVVPGAGSVELRAPFAKPETGPTGQVTGRIDDAGRRVPLAKALQILLVSDKGWWRTSVDVKEGAFRFTGVGAGTYRVMAMAGDTAIAQRDWFELAAAEVRDVGVLITEPAGSVVIALDRDAETQELEPTIYLRREGWSHGSQIAMGRRSEARLENQTPGKYTVTGYASGMMALKAELEIRAGEDSSLRFQLKPAALVPFEIWFPEGSAPGVTTIRVAGADQTVLSEHTETLAVPPRPHEMRRHVPRGRWTIAVTTELGMSGNSEFVVDSPSRAYAVVRVQVQ